MNNKEIREAALRHRLKLWEVANRCGLSDAAFSRKLRHELPDEEKARILEIIEELAKEA